MCLSIRYRFPTITVAGRQYYILDRIANIFWLRKALLSTTALPNSTSFAFWLCHQPLRTTNRSRCSKESIYVFRFTHQLVLIRSDCREDGLGENEGLKVLLLEVCDRWIARALPPPYQVNSRLVLVHGVQHQLKFNDHTSILHIYLLPILCVEFNNPTQHSISRYVLPFLCKEFNTNIKSTNMLQHPIYNITVLVHITNWFFNNHTPILHTCYYPYVRGVQHQLDFNNHTLIIHHQLLLLVFELDVGLSILYLNFLAARAYKFICIMTWFRDISFFPLTTWIFS